MNGFFFNLKFLCYAISPSNNKANLDFLHKSIKKIKWKSLIGIAHWHLLVPSLWANLRAKNLEYYLDEEIRDYLHNFYNQNLQRNIGLKQQTLEAVDVLNNQGITPLLFKGAVQLFQPINRDSGSRMMVDLDILIPINQLKKAVKAIHSIGYKEINNETNYNKAKHHHWAPLFRSGEYGKIDLHHEALNFSAARVLPTNLIWAKAQSKKVQGVHFYMPDPTHSFMIGMLHSQLANRFFYLHFLDLKALLESTALILRYSDKMDFEEIQSMVDKKELYHILQTYLFTANLLFNLSHFYITEPTIKSRIHYKVSLAVLRWGWAEKLATKYDAFTDQQICRRYRCENRAFPLFVNKFKYLFKNVRNILNLI
jgi:hypothetical protein